MPFVSRMRSPSGDLIRERAYSFLHKERCMVKVSLATFILGLVSKMVLQALGLPLPEQIVILAVELGIIVAILLLRQRSRILKNPRR